MNKKLSRISLSGYMCRYLWAICLVTSISTCSLVALANNAVNSDLGPWSILLYRGSTATQAFAELLGGKYNSAGEDLYTAELAYTLDQSNVIRKFFRPVFDLVQVAGNVTYRHDYNQHDDVTEGNLYLIWRFTKFPWEHYLKNSIAIGDGISYASHSPYADRNPAIPASNYSKLLNYLMLEVTFAAPLYPALQLALRIHHRCTVWGTFPKKANAGSTSIGLGVRYYF